MNQSKGFISLGIILAVVIGIAVLGGAGSYFSASQKASSIRDAYASRQEVNKVFFIMNGMVYMSNASVPPSVMKEADAATFVSTGEYTAKDKNHTYGINAKGFLIIDSDDPGPSYADERAERMGENREGGLLRPSTVSGKAPLTVTFSPVPRIPNWIDFGDGGKVRIKCTEYDVAGACINVGMYSHTYERSGTYTVSYIKEMVDRDLEVVTTLTITVQ